MYGNVHFAQYFYYFADKQSGVLRAYNEPDNPNEEIPHSEVI